MKEAIGNAFVFGLVITFVAIFIILFATSSSYTKAFKVKNKIVEILEKYDDILGVNVADSTGLNSTVESEINNVLNTAGYRISTNPNNCPARNGVDAVNKKLTSNYEYCIYAYSTNKGTYYGVTAYMYYQIPVIGVELRFPVYGETKINGLLR